MIKPLFPITRHRRLRYNPTLRELIAETSLSINDLIMPLFVCTGKNIQKEIISMPGNFQFSIDNLVEKCKTLYKKNINIILLFGIPPTKDDDGTVATHDDSIIQQAIRAIKKEIPKMYVIADICNCEYTIHGHCGTIIDGDVDNDLTLRTLANQAVSIARAGADMVAPSDMMDGRVSLIRKSLDKNNFHKIPIMSYAAKFTSAFYGPFREAAESTPQFGDRKTYQMDFRNSYEALREIESDINEGADIVMIKPALSYLDIISKTKQKYNIPIAAYNVSGEFSMVKATGEKGWIDEKKVMLEILYSIKRAGADIIITYHAEEVVEILNKQ